MNSRKENFVSQKNYRRAPVILVMLLAIILWASAFPAIRLSLTAYSSAEVAFLRYFFASITLIFYAIFKQMPMPKIEDLPLISLCGFLGFALYNLMLNQGQVTTPAGIASFIVSSSVGIIAILAWIFYQEHLGKFGWLGVTLCILGVAIISFDTGGNETSLVENQWQMSLGAILVFIATLSGSLYSILQKPLLKKYSAIQFTTYAIWTGTIFLFFLAPHSLFLLQNAPISPTISIIYMGLFPGVIAYVAWSYVLSKIPVSIAGSYLALIPVLALFIAWILLGEIPTLISLIGGTIILSGVTIVNKIK